MAKDACVNCGKPLPPNKELASVPHARLVAFDPDANRVWRICEACNHWHLLGPQAARAAMPELQSRYDIEVAAGEGQLAMASVSKDLLLFRVGAQPSKAAADLFASDIHAGLGTGTPWQIWALVAGTTVVLIGAIWALDQFDAWRVLNESKGSLLFFWSFLVVSNFLGGRESARGMPRWMRWFWVPLTPMLVWEITLSPMPVWSRLLTIGVGGALGAWIGRSEGKPRGIRWEHRGDAVSYHDGLYGDQRGWAAATVLLFELGKEFADKAKPADRELAWNLWQEHGSLPTLLDAFAERRDATGLLRLTALTKPERMALLIAVGARLAEPPAEVIAGLEEAERVAAIAEALDNELSPPTPHAPLPPAPLA